MADFVINPKDQESIKAFGEHFRTFNKPFLIKTETIEKRSIDYNKYYWGCIIEYIIDETGNDPLIVHEVLSSRFLKVSKQKKLSSAGLNTKDFRIYTTQCRLWALEQLHIFIPVPENFIQ